jgi:hypothetical protein
LRYSSLAGQKEMADDVEALTGNWRPLPRTILMSILTGWNVNSGIMLMAVTWMERSHETVTGTQIEASLGTVSMSSVVFRWQRTGPEDKRELIDQAKRKKMKGMKIGERTGRRNNSFPW